MSVNEIGDFIIEKYYKRIGFSKEKSYYFMKCLKKEDLLLLATKLTEKIPDPCNAKEHYQSFIKKKNKRSVKQSTIVTQQPKTCKTPNIVDIKLVIIEHPKISHNLSKTIKTS